MKTASAVVKAETNTAEASPPEARELLIRPSNCQVNSAGQHWKEMFIRASEGMTADDLRNGKIWRAVQGVPQAALTKCDRLFVVGWDESWYADCLVKQATSTSATLLILRVGSFAAIDERLYRDSDGTLEVFWSGSSYSVRRIQDQVPVSTGHATEGAAIEALRNFHPRSVGR